MPNYSNLKVRNGLKDYGTMQWTQDDMTKITLSWKWKRTGNLLRIWINCQVELSIENILLALQYLNVEYGFSLFVGWSSKSLANFDQQPGHSLIMLFSSTYVHIWAQGNVFKLRVDDFAKVLADLAQQKVVLGRPTGKDTLCKFLHFQNDLDSPFLDCSVHLWIGFIFDVIQICRYFYCCQNIIQPDHLLFSVAPLQDKTLEWKSPDLPQKCFIFILFYLIPDLEVFYFS